MQLYELKGDRNKWKKQLGALLLIIALVSILSVQYSHIASVKAKKGARISCSAFSSQADAQKAYKKGAKYLDGHPQNGLACDSYFKTKKK